MKKSRHSSVILSATLALAVLLIGCGDYGVEREPVAATQFAGDAPNQNGPPEYSRPAAGYTHTYDAEAFIEEFSQLALVVLWDHDFSGENNRDLAQLHVDRGLAYMELGRLRDALLDYDEAIQIYPSLAEAYANRAVVRVLLGMNAEAEQDVLRAEELGVHAGAPDQARDEVRSAP